MGSDSRGCKEVLKAKGYLRYVDDFALFHDDPERLEDWRRRIARFLEGRRLRLHPRKTVIVETNEPAGFLGFVLLPGGRRRLPEGNVRRFRNRLRGLRDRWRRGTVIREEVERRVGAWVAHAGHSARRAGPGPTDRLESYVAKLHAHIANGADPALVAPSINSANAILKERRVRKDDGEAVVASAPAVLSRSGSKS